MIAASDRHILVLNKLNSAKLVYFGPSGKGRESAQQYTKSSVPRC
jgi:hypothetical protein